MTIKPYLAVITIDRHSSDEEETNRSSDFNQNNYAPQATRTVAEEYSTIFGECL